MTLLWLIAWFLIGIAQADLPFVSVFNGVNGWGLTLIICMFIDVLGASRS